MRPNLFFAKFAFVFLFFGYSLVFISTASGQDLSDIKNVKPVTLNGSLGANMVFYNAKGIKARQDPFSYGFNANATLALYGISMPFSFTWYNNNSSYSQPFNQFGISPKYKWITGHFGYRNLTFSEFTLNGHTFFGAGVEMNPGKFRFGAVYGKFNQNSEFDPYMADSLPNFKRKGWAVKVGYGDEKNFIDFSMLRIGDDSTNFKPSKNIDSPLPQQNMVYGVNSKFSLLKKLAVEIDGSISIYTDNRIAPRLSSIDDTWLAFSDRFMTINQTSQHYSALKTALIYNFTDKISTGIEYRRIAPGYQSMGAYFFNNDVENITINQSYTFLKDKLNARGSIGLQRDNLDKTKKATSKRTVGSVNLSYNLNQNFGVDANYSNFTTNQRAGRIPIVDSLKLFQVNHNISITPRYMKVTANLSNMVVLNMNFMKLDDKNKKTQNQTQTNTSILFLNYSLGFIPQKLTLSLGLNYTKLNNNYYKNTISGLTAGVSKLVFADAMTININSSYMLNKVNADNGTIFTTSFMVNYRFAKKQTLGININYLKNSFENKAPTLSYNEFRGDFSYVFTF